MGLPGAMRVGCLAAVAAVAAGRTFRYGALGDFGTGGYDAGMKDETLSALGYFSTAEEHNTTFTLSTGDNIYVGDTNLGIRQSFENLWTKEGVHHGGPWLMSVGNHDNVGTQINYGKENKKWIWPSAYFTKVFDTDLGFSVQVWSVNTHSFDGNQQQWLEKTLQESTARWKVFFTHYPWLSSGRHRRVSPPTQTAQLAKKYNVQVVFNGHDHLLQALVHEGVAFVGTGATARGAMLNRGIDQDKTQFLFAFGIHASVGYHGVAHITLTRNVMWCHFYGRENMVNEFVTTYDWPKKWKDSCSEEVKNDQDKDRCAKVFPSRAVIFDHLATEADTYNDTDVAETLPPQTEKPNENVKTLTAEELKAKAEKRNSDAEKIEVGDLASKAEQVESLARTQPRVSFVASSPCPQCEGRPTLGHPLRIWLQGLEDYPLKDGETQMVWLMLAKTSQQCIKQNEDVMVRGVKRTAVTGPIVTVQTSSDLTKKVATAVCLTVDGGKTYFPAKRAPTEEEFFDLHPEPEGGTTAAPLPTEAPKVRVVKINTIPASSSNGVPIQWFYLFVAVAAGAVFYAWRAGRQASAAARNAGR